MAAFRKIKMFDLGEDSTTYDLIGDAGTGPLMIEGEEFTQVSGSDLTFLCQKAFSDCGHLMRSSHLEKLSHILSDSDASSNDRFVALDLLKNAVIASSGVLPMCQDTGTAIVMGRKGHRILTNGQDDHDLSRGVYQAYQDKNFRYSQMSALNMFDEVNTKTNLPAQIDLYATHGSSYDFLFMAKGGGSANKTFLYQQTRALLEPERLLSFLDEQLRTLGTSACPPYHLAVVIGGTSAEMNLKTVKMASAHGYDNLPHQGGEYGQAYRDLEWEHKILELTQNFGIGAQFGGKYFCHDVRVIRLARHGASCPVGIGVSCSADRQIKGRITSKGCFLERLEKDPARFLPVVTLNQVSDDVVDVDLNMGMDNILSQLKGRGPRTRLNLNGRLVVARDIAHARLAAHLQSGGQVPGYMKEYPVYYAGPAKCPQGYASGSFGPTTAGRMDPYVSLLQSHGASMVMLAKGNRSPSVRESCARHGGFYLGSVGGPGARLAYECITQVDVIDYQDLGMEAVHLIEVSNFPAFIIIDETGNDFYHNLRPGAELSL